MDDLTTLLQDFKLDTHFTNGRIEHVYNECDKSSGKRVIERREQWKRMRRIGRGSYGEVWLEECVEGGQIGSLRATKDIWSYGQINYARELEALSVFSKASCARWFCQSFGWYQTANTVSIVMEYFPLGDLQAYTSQPKKTLLEEDVQQITLQVLEGLDYMHKRNVAHRDIKPSVSLTATTRDSWLSVEEHTHPIVSSTDLVGQDKRFRHEQTTTRRVDTVGRWERHKSVHGT